MIFTTNETLYRVTTVVNSLANTCLLNMKLFSRANQQQCHFPYWEQDLVIRKEGKGQIVQWTMSIDMYSSHLFRQALKT